MFSLGQVLASHSHSVTNFTRKKDQKHFRQQQKSGNSAKISALLNMDIHLDHQLQDYMKTLKFLDLRLSLTLLLSLLWPNFPPHLRRALLQGRVHTIKHTAWPTESQSTPRRFSVSRVPQQEIKHSAQSFTCLLLWKAELKETAPVK